MASHFQSLFPNMNLGETSGPQAGRQPTRATSGSHGIDGIGPFHGNAKRTGSDAQSNLLGLLKFASPSSPQTTSLNAQATENPRPTTTTSDAHMAHGRGISASELVASLRGGGAKPSIPAQPVPRTSSASHQDSLLKLLNQTAAVTEEAKPTTSNKDQSPAIDTPSRSSPPIRVFGSKEATPTPFQPESISKPSSVGKDTPIFTYVNPFEQLSASSPLNSDPRNKRNKPSHDNSKRNLKSPSPAIAQASSRRKLTDSGNEVLQSIETPDQGPQKHTEGPTEKLMGIGAPSRDAETVAEALNEVGDQVHKQMEYALEEAESQQTKAKKAAVKSSTEERSLPAMSTTESQTVDLDDSIEVKDLGILTYQIPMKPFVLIEIKREEIGIPLREDCIVNIARFRKDFDQIDRTLTTASKDFIVYGMARNGGIRVIEQENGASNLLFPNTQDRVFNVAISSANARPGLQCLLGTGVSGTVYWTTIATANEELTEADMEANSLIIPPSSGGLDSTSNGQLKTRAKRSNRHPDFFAIGRGKSIHIVFPSHARQSSFTGSDNVLDTDAYFTDRNMKITTGKAGKDFAFSEDDTVIATLDKAGKLRLWDIRDLTHPDNATASILAPIEVKQPLLSFTTASSSDKIWPSSVLFVDKIRSYQKGVAQRYIIVGMNQNHTLQLWDLCLRKAVQELSFPHENENDAICSVVFHPEASIIVVGHPTRNSIYIIQLSAPKFHLPNISQAKLGIRLANNDPSLPKTEATAIMSNFREYSPSSIGQLRSLDLTPPCGETLKASEGPEELQLFDLYVMHSKGVTCVGVRREDMGWSAAGKTLHPIDAVDGGQVVIKDLRETPAQSQSDPASLNGDPVPATPTKASLRSGVKDADKIDRKIASLTSKSTDKVEKKKSKQDVTSESLPKSSVGVSEPAVLTPRDSSPMPQSSTNGAKETSRQSAQKSSLRSTTDALPSQAKDVKGLSNGESISLGISSNLIDKEMRKIEQGVSAEFNKSLQRELNSLHRRLDSDKQVHNATVASNQEAILRLVSKQLGDNVEKSLASIITNSIRESVGPSITKVTANILEKSLPFALDQSIEHLLPLHLKPIIPEAIKSVMQTREMHRGISDQLASGIKGQLEKEILNAMHKSLLPEFQKMAIGAAQKASQDTEFKVRAQFQQAEAQRREDSAKIDQLSNSVRVLSETIHQMAEAQRDFQSEILLIQQKALQDNQAVIRQGSPTPSESASANVTAEQQEFENVSSIMQKGQFEQATIIWLQSSQQNELFDKVFARYDPSYLRQVQQLVLLSVGAAVVKSFDTSLQQRLTWIEFAMACLNPNHPEIQQVARKVMDHISQRLSNTYMQIAEEQPNHPALRQIAHLSKRARELIDQSPIITE